MKDRWQAVRGLSITAAAAGAAAAIATGVVLAGGQHAPSAAGALVAGGSLLAALAALLLRRRERASAHDRERALGVALEEQRAEFETISRRAVHDLRNPLNTIGLNVHLLRTALAREDTALAGTAIEHIERAKDQMVHVVDALRAVSRASFGELALEVVDMSAQARAAAAELRGSTPRERLSDVEVLPLPACVADPHLMRVLLKNLMEHVIASTGGAVRLTVGFDQDRGGEYYVGDAGTVTDAAAPGDLFEPRPGAGDGTGGGAALAVAARIVARHGGRLRASGTGQVVRFSLPPADAADATANVTDKTPGRAAIGSDRGAIREN